MRPGRSVPPLRAPAAVRVGLTRVHCVRGFSIAGKEFKGQVSIKLERDAPTPAVAAVAGGA